MLDKGYLKGSVDNSVLCTARATLRRKLLKVGGGETREQWSLCAQNEKGGAWASKRDI